MKYLADVIAGIQIGHGKNKIMNEIISPPCNSQADTESVVRDAVSPYPFDVSEEKIAGQRGEESPVGGPE